MRELVKKFKIITLLRINIYVAVVFLVICSAVGTLATNMVNKELNTIYDYQNWDSVIVDMQRDFREIRSIEENEINLENVELLGLDLKEYSDSFDEGYKTYTAAESDPEEEVFLEVIGANYEAYFSEISNLLSAVENGEEISEDSIENLEILCSEIDEALIGLEDYVNFWIDEAKNESDVVYGKMKQVLIGILITILIIFFIFYNFITRALKAYMNRTEDELSDISKGDLSREMIITGSNELEMIKLNVKEVIDSFKNMIIKVVDSSQDVSGKSEELNSISKTLAENTKNISLAIEEVANGTSEQASDLVEIGTILNSFSIVIEELVNNIAYINNGSKVISDSAGISGEKMINLNNSFNLINNNFKILIDRIEKLGSNIEKVDEITNFINDISEQTNLLALNAAIEAARAGESGKGFAVVAEEIRNLAEESKQSVERINVLINEISSEADIIVNNSEEMSKDLMSSNVVIEDSMNAFTQIIDLVGKIAPKVEELNLSSKKIEDEKNTIVGKIGNSSAIAEQISAASEEITASIKEIAESSDTVENTSEVLEELTIELNNNISIFKI